MNAILTALTAAVAVFVELMEALAIVLAVGASRRWSDALWGAVAGVLACALVAAVAGPLLLSELPLDTLRLVIGVLLLLLGVEWLRKGTMRLAGRRARSSSVAEYDEARRELDDRAADVDGTDWPARIVAFKGVLLEGLEVVVIVTALAAKPSGLGPALAGAIFALLVVVFVGFWLRAPLARLPETELKYAVGVILTSFGAFFAAEGLGVEWPGSDAALLYLAATLVAATMAQIRLGRRAAS